MRSLLYVSRQAAGLGDLARAVADIVTVAAARNAGLDVTGAFLSTGVHFAQILEGPAAGVGEIMASIARDPRHTDVVILADGGAPERAFPEWSLAYLGEASYVDALVVDALENPGPRPAERIGRLLREFARQGGAPTAA